MVGSRKTVLRMDVVRKFKVWERTVGLASFNPQLPTTSTAMALVDGAYRLDWANGGVRIETANQARSVSPRLTKRGLVEWMEAGILTVMEVTRCRP